MGVSSRSIRRSRALRCLAVLPTLALIPSCAGSVSRDRPVGEPERHATPASESSEESSSSEANSVKPGPSERGLEHAARQQSYDLSALISAPGGFAPPKLGIQRRRLRNVIREEDKGTAEPPARSDALRDHLLARLRADVAPKIWDAGGTLLVRDDEVLVQAPESAHAALRQFLESEHRLRSLRCVIEARQLLVSEPLLALSPGLHVARLRQSLESDAAPTQGSWSGEEFEQLAGELGAAKRESSALIIAARNAELTHALIVKQEALIVDIVERIVGEAKLQEPEIGILQTGLTLAARPFFVDQQEPIDLEVEWQMAEVRRPIEAQKVGGIPIAQPELSLHSDRASLQLAPGHWHLALSHRLPAGAPGAEPDDEVQWVLLFLRARVEEPPAAPETEH